MCNSDWGPEHDPDWQHDEQAPEDEEYTDPTVEPPPEDY